MQVNNDMVLFFSCHSFILPPKNVTFLAEEVQCKSEGPSNQISLPYDITFSGSNNDNAKRVVLSQHAFLRHSEME
jgi:hypothetical protein